MSEIDITVSVSDVEIYKWERGGFSCCKTLSDWMKRVEERLKELEEREEKDSE